MPVPPVAVHGHTIAGGKTTPVPIAAVAVGDGTYRLVVEIAGAAITLTASELEIGHTVQKNDLTEDHTTVAADGQVLDANHPLEGAAQLIYDGANWRVLRGDSAGNVGTKAQPGTTITAGANTTPAAVATALPVPPAGTRRMTIQNIGNVGSESQIREVSGTAGTGLVLARFASASFGGADGAIAAMECDDTTLAPILSIVFEN